ncbi:MAG: hypothetical protein ABW047_00045 [Nitrospiraceae bacterium]|jgi:hypothetical protein
MLIHIQVTEEDLAPGINFSQLSNYDQQPSVRRHTIGATVAKTPMATQFDLSLMTRVNHEPREICLPSSICGGVGSLGEYDHRMRS